ncbi:adrenodoxin-like isoform X1 [Mizuhopecten yessoensis]|uniref:Adrenodoxin, mitochondrial n=1 Tax=Mizuhopecten yessoensis TaxID=6573 RepID=A0A210PM15_MIZYE|nr:adrenodoxin-like isoform X1 [Mizuhopecten yessoensis]OWF37525.1 Adrenodoxin, mitochondrial [Mizuhopecten yessoensis]
MACRAVSLRFLIPKFASCVNRGNSGTIPALIRKTQHTRNSASRHRFSSTAAKPKKETITVHFVQSDGSKFSTTAAVGENLLDIIIDNDIDIDGFGACEGTLACSTCHLIFKQEDYDKIPDKPTDEELDMLDLAYGLSSTSRLGCQVVLTKDMDGLQVQVPTAVVDARDPS